MSYSLSQAATAIGMYRSTVLRAIKAGKISAIKDEHGQWQIEPAELHRVSLKATTVRRDNTHALKQRSRCAPNSPSNGSP
jgi:predicted site-specific integrase-resolvase